MILKKRYYSLSPSLFLFIATMVGLVACSQPESPKVSKNTAKGSLFIIGGGKRPPDMITFMMETAGLDASDPIVILPWASEETDTAAFYAEKQFIDLGHQKFLTILPADLPDVGPEVREQVKAAKLIYVPGGDQRRFMEAAKAYRFDELLHEAYQNGGMVAGTSAGAAIMSQQMITGTALRFEEYHPTFRTLQSENLELEDGLGLLPSHIVIDQHFIWRSRYNRLLTAIIEDPARLGWGIEESTAAYVSGDSVQVVGKYQLIVFSNQSKQSRERDGNLGEPDVRLSIYLPGDTFALYGDQQAQKP